MKMMMFKTIKIMMVIGVLVEGVRETLDASEGSNKDDFELLCNVTRVTLGLWYTVTGAGYTSDDLIDKVDESTKIIDDIFFDVQDTKYSGLFWTLPDKFIKSRQKRSTICLANNGSNGMPSPSKSLVSAFLCLCTRMESNRKDFCGLEIDGKNIWTDYDNINVKDAFEEVWGSEFKSRIKKRCEGTDSDTVEVAQQNLSEILKIFKTSLITKQGIFGKDSTTCGTSNACANVTTTPTWLNKLEKVEQIAKHILTRLKTLEQESKIKLIPAAETQSTSKHTLESASLEPQVYNPQGKQHTTSPTSLTAPEKTHQQQSRKFPGEKPKQEHEPEMPVGKPHKQAEDFPPPENETSSSIINITKWPFLATLLI
ncbi:Variant surface glycoprotein [Trypanosoma congolense IL3000]|uniref:Variant surface glycoprotein n=1 Tax=Trypanosoma congolense (strain IL3000) TaxID=1068625 RepID=F9W8Z3_TRYCI|nr:Variant surface glycoprotein [Trypanosoma congolense IL3000]